MADLRQTDLQPLLAIARAAPSLTEMQTYDAFSIILRGRADDSPIGSLLTILAQRGPTVEELVGAAHVMREHVTRVPVAEEWRGRIIDTCGTGGAPKTFNVSTAAALVAAGAGARVAKHGNRSRTGRGSAEVLDRLGVKVDASPEAQARCLEEAGVCFSFAIHHHPATRHAMAARRSLAFPTIFNLLGPLTNPAGARRQLIGVYAPAFTELVARSLVELGSDRAMVVHGHGGLDELSISGPNRVSVCVGGEFDLHIGGTDGGEVGIVICTTSDPAEFGIVRGSIEDVGASSLDQSARIIIGVLDGQAGPHLEMVALNAGAALLVAAIADDLRQGVEMARESIASGRARLALHALIEVSNRS